MRRLFAAIVLLLAVLAFTACTPETGSPPAENTAPEPQSSAGLVDWSQRYSNCIGFTPTYPGYCDDPKPVLPWPWFDPNIIQP